MQNEQVADEIKKVVSFSLYNELRDPAFRDVTITRVKVSPDLQFADIRFTSMDRENSVEAIEEKLNHAVGAFRSILAKKIRIRKTPQLRFHYDADILAEQKIEEILQKLKVSEDSAEE